MTLRQKLKNEVTRPAYVRLSSTHRRYKKKDGSYSVRNTSVDLCLNVGVIRMCSLKQGDMVDLFYERYNKEWERPILIIKKNGTQRKLTGTIRKANWLTIAVGMAVKQWDIPLILGRHLDVLDYVDGDIIIDITDKNAELHAAKEKIKKKERLTTVMAYAIGKGNGYVFKSTQSMKDKMKEVSRREDRAVNRIIIDALEAYLEEHHDDLCR